MAAAISTQEQQAALSAKFSDCAPEAFIDALSLHPELLTGLLLEGRIPFKVFRDRPELVLPCFRATEDKWAFARLVAPYLQGVPEAVAEQLVLAGRLERLPDSLLAEALANIYSPWRLNSLGYVNKAAANREAMAGSLAVKLSETDMRTGARAPRLQSKASCSSDVLDPKGISPGAGKRIFPDGDRRPRWIGSWRSP